MFPAQGAQYGIFSGLGQAAPAPPTPSKLTLSSLTTGNAVIYLGLGVAVLAIGGALFWKKRKKG